jgi:hypothetical protein
MSEKNNMNYLERSLGDADGKVRQQEEVAHFP